MSVADFVEKVHEGSPLPRAYPPAGGLEGRPVEMSDAPEVTG